MHDRGPTLLAIARATIARSLGTPASAAEDAPFLREPGACFVTLTCDDELRGCIGSIEAHRSLLDDVKKNAYAAAFQDPRFPPLQAREFELVQVEVSLLSPQEELACADEEQACELLRPGVDGVVMEYGHHRSTFLPQVWEQLPEPSDFLEQLKRKAGLPGYFWAEDIRLYRYTVDKWCESDADRA